MEISPLVFRGYQTSVGQSAGQAFRTRLPGADGRAGPPSTSPPGPQAHKASAASGPRQDRQVHCGARKQFLQREAPPLTLPCSLLQELGTERGLERRSKPGVRAGGESPVTATVGLWGCVITVHYSSRGASRLRGCPETTQWTQVSSSSSPSPISGDRVKAKGGIEIRRPGPGDSEERGQGSSTKDRLASAQDDRRDQHREGP